MISKSFLKSSLVYTIIGALPVASGFILLLFYANLLETAHFGELALYIGFTLFIQLLVNWNLDTAIAVYYYECKHDKQKLKEYVGTIANSLLIFGVIATLLFTVLGNLLFEVLFKKGQINFFPYGFMSVLTAIFNSYFKTYTTLLIYQERPIRFFWLNILNFVLTIAISLIGLYAYPYTLIGPMWGRFLSGIGIFMAAAYFFYTEFGLYFELDLVKKFVSYSTPILLFGIVSWALSYADIYIINRYITVSDTGIFDFAIKCTLLIDFVLNALNTAIAPKIYSVWTEQKVSQSTPEVNRYYNAFTAIAILIIALNIFLVPIGVPLIVKKVNYYEALQYVPYLALSYSFRGLYIMFFLPIYFFKKTKQLPVLYGILAIFKIGLSIVLIKYYGMWGVILVLIFIKIIEVLGLSISSKSFFSFKFNKIKLIALPIAYTVLVVLLEQLTGIVNSHLLHFISLLIAILAITWIYKNEIRVTVLSLIKK